MKDLVIDYLTRFGCECKISLDGKCIVARRLTSELDYYYSFEVPRSMLQLCYLTSRLFPEYLGLYPRSFADVAALRSLINN